MRHTLNYNKSAKENSPYYRSDIEYIEDHFRLLDLWIERKQIRDFEDPDALSKNRLRDINKKIYEKMAAIEKKQKYSLDQKKSFSLDRVVDKNQLGEIEKKIILFLLYRYFSSDNQETTGRALLENITNSRLEMMRSRNYLMEGSKLRNNQLITCEETGEEKSILDTPFSLSEDVISELLGESEIFLLKEKKAEDEKNYKSYLNLYFNLVQQMQKKSELLSIFRNDRNSLLAEYLPSSENSSEVNRLRHNIRKTKALIDEFEGNKENFPIEKVTKEYQLELDEKLILVILLQESLGFSDSFGGCEGKKLLAIVSESENEMIGKRCLLYKDGKLRRNKLLELEKSWGGQNILDAEYFLSERMIRKLLGELPEGNTTLLEEDCLEGPEEGQILLSLTPRFAFGDVIMADEKKKMIEVALSQQVNHKLIFETWGFAKKIPYGNSLTMLFSGGPGTGKTMMAEAIANYLGKKLLIANYAQIQNLYVGETEKRIVAAFRQAKEQDGVLLWDEADSMFYSRDIASHSWEYRDVNVILQELEKFAGVVILTTNRKVALDRALDRRISLKVHFDMPDAKARERIWKQLIPAEAPLEEGLNFATLAEKYEISGGTIKNAILHAARYAAYTKGNQLRMEDLIQGVEMHLESGWANPNKMGFGK